MKTTRYKAAILLLLFAVGVVATGALAQDEGWVVPDDYVPPTDIPVVPPQPFAPFGPVTFNEAEFPIDGNVDGFTTNTLGGAPLDGPLSFGAPAGATFSDGPGMTALFVPRGVVGQAAQPLTIDFGVDVTEVSFIFNLGGPMFCNGGGVDVTAFDSGMGVVGMTSEAGVDMGFFFEEGQVTAFSPGVFRSIEIAVTGPPGCDRYAIDALAYDTVAPAPAMGTVWLAALATALLAIGAWFARRRESA